MGRIANKRDVLAGLMFVGIGLGALAVATGYRMGTPVRMGATVLRSSSAGPAALAALLARSRWV